MKFTGEEAAIVKEMRETNTLYAIQLLIDEKKKEYDRGFNEAYTQCNQVGLEKQNEAKIEAVLKILEVIGYNIHYRKGQAVFNYMYVIFPEECDKLRGTEYDCFYVTDKVPVFIEQLKLLLSKKNESV